MQEVITDDGVRLNYVVDDYREPWRGEAAATVLLHHGFVKTLEHWTPFVPAIARRHRVVRFDVRGAGQSGVPPEGSEWTPERLVRDALNLIDALGIANVHWAGFESGGVVGLQFAAAHPERTASVACFNTPYRGSSSKAVMREHFCRGYANPAEAIDGLGYDAWIRGLCERGVLIDTDDPAIVAWVAEQALRIPAAIAKSWHAVFWDAPDLFTDLPERVAAPVLLVAGARHVHGCEPPLLDGLRRRFRDARDVVYIPGVAIGVQLLAADACAAAYLDFLGSLDQANVPIRP